MRISRRYAPLVYSSVAALAGAAVGFVLVRQMAIDTWAVKRADDRRKIVSTSQPSELRLRHAPSDALTRPEPPSDALPWKLSVLPEAIIPSPWSTEVKPTVTPPLTRPALPKKKTKRSRAPRQSVTLKSRLAEISPRANIRLIAKFKAAKVTWPPAKIALVAIKDEKVVELHARSKNGTWKHIHRYPVFAASGGAGPKLQQGDRQVPEGVYRIVYLNPRSAYHVSLRVNYPNKFDRRMAAKDGRKRLGGDIMIHGKNSSAGCLAMGDDAAEELFVLSAKTGYTKTKLIIAPTDFRTNGLPDLKRDQPKWLPKLYAEISTAMAEFKRPRSPGLLSLFTW